MIRLNATREQLHATAVASQPMMPVPGIISRLLSAAALFALGAAPCLRVQAAESTVGSEATRMNPFEVVEAKDSSFTTSSVGTGGRLVLDLKDVPASYVVINRAFIDALGITDMNEA